MPDSRFSSLNFSPNLDSFPYNKWLSFIENDIEFRKIIRLFKSTPKDWLLWTEKRVISAQKRGVEIQKPIPYRISVLTNGIVLLQESKFICDILENTFRSSFLQFCISNQISYIDLINKSFPRKSIISTLEKRFGYSFFENSNRIIIHSEFILELNFSDLYSLMHQYWDKIKVKNNYLFGFSNIFWSSIKLRDKRLFLNDMRKVKDYRNIIAHSKQLFLPHETKKIYEITRKWLLPINIHLENQILTYITHRPAFLKEFIIG